MWQKLKRVLNRCQNKLQQTKFQLSLNRLIMPAMLIWLHNHNYSKQTKQVKFKKILHLTCTQMASQKMKKSHNMSIMKMEMKQHRQIAFHRNNSWSKSNSSTCTSNSSNSNSYSSSSLSNVPLKLVKIQCKPQKRKIKTSKQFKQICQLKTNKKKIRPKKISKKQITYQI